MDQGTLAKGGSGISQDMWGANRKGGRRPVIWPNLSKKCMNMKIIGLKKMGWWDIVQVRMLHECNIHVLACTIFPIDDRPKVVPNPTSIDFETHTHKFLYLYSIPKMQAS